jgi:exodeoxyribonuclease VII large subunit
MGQRLQNARQQFTALSHNLDAVSPLATLGRGYAIVSRETDGHILRNAADSAVGEKVQARLGKGVLHCRVENIDDEDTIGK